MLNFQQPILFLKKSFKYIIKYELQLQIGLLPQKNKQIIVRFKLKLNKYGILKRDPEIV